MRKSIPVIVASAAWLAAPAWAQEPDPGEAPLAAAPQATAVPALAAAPQATAVPALAAAPQEPPPAPRARTPGDPEQPTPPPGKPAVARAKEEAGQLANVKIDVTITDQRGDHAPIAKTVTLTVADRGNGQIRSEGKVFIKGHGFEALRLAVDLIRPTIEGNRVRAQLGVNYDILETATGGDSPPRADVRYSLAVVLEHGKSTVVAQSADPATDRRVTLEVKATILR